MSPAEFDSVRAASKAAYEKSKQGSVIPTVAEWEESRRQEKNEHLPRTPEQQAQYERALEERRMMFTGKSSVSRAIEG